jgi:hypothetical protein
MRNRRSEIFVLFWFTQGKLARLRHLRGQSTRRGNSRQPCWIETKVTNVVRKDSIMTELEAVSIVLILTRDE